MIDIQTLEQTYGAEALADIGKAFAILAEYDVYKTIMHGLKTPLYDSFEMNPDELAKKIISVQQTNRFLLTLKEKGREITERYVV